MEYRLRPAIEREVPSVCPVCLTALTARLRLEGEGVVILKTCPKHGQFEDVYWSDAALLQRFLRFGLDGESQAEPNDRLEGCPSNCGLCTQHRTPTLLANIDLTDRCDLRCPICFARSAEGGAAEPSIQQLEEMMRALRSQRPVGCQAVQFSGGEPTLREDLPTIIRMARRMGFSQIQIATNGLRLAQMPGLASQLRKSGLDTVYLQFDGVTSEAYRLTRGRDLLDAKERSVKVCRESGMESLVLVPTVARGLNDDQLYAIVKYARQNTDIVRGVNFQPVSFSGRVDLAERTARRITVSDVLRLLEEQSDGRIARDDFYPVPFVDPIARLIETESGQPQARFSIHPCCGAATYLYISREGPVPITRFLDVERLMERIKDSVEKSDGSALGRLRARGTILKQLHSFIDETRAPADLHISGLLRGVLKSGTKDALREFHRKTLFIGVMHFQDLYNMDLNRLRRCGIHYATPDGRIIPFCAYNNIHRRFADGQGKCRVCEEKRSSEDL
ncbi:MAG: molybdenum cofactor biosynthesis protein A [Methanosaeta sp. PtaU1.Bin028]|nr:MAG: molybdenum cofactor biosynthesis protein A [Methanosaeta sp. PtaU1.Bin028]